MFKITYCNQSHRIKVLRQVTSIYYNAQHAQSFGSAAQPCKFKIQKFMKQNNIHLKHRL